MAIKGTFQFPELAAKPSSPPVGSIILYVKTDNVLYIQDSTGTEYAFGSVDFISQLVGDVSAIGPGIATATVNSVGGSSASAIHTAEVLANAATASNSPNQIIKRDASGNYAANVGSLFALKLLGSTSGTLTLASPAVFTDYTLTLPTTFGLAGQALTSNGDGTTGWTTFLLPSLTDGKIWVGNGSNIATPQTPSGDVSMSDTGVFTVNTVGGSTAANIHSAELLANAATAANTSTAIVRRDGSGSIAISALSAISGSFVGAADIVQLIVKGFAGQGSDIFQVQKSDSTVYFKVDANGNANVLGTITASNFSGSSSGTNTGDVTLAAVGSSPNANAASLSGQVLNLQPADGTHPGVLTAIAQFIGGVKTFLAQLLVTDTTDSTSTSTGSIVTSGGVGIAKNLYVGGTAVITGSLSALNFSGSSSGTNTGDVTKTDTDSVAISLTGQNISANLKLSADAADAGNLKATTTVHSGANAGLHVEVPFATPVNIGTTNNPGSASSVALSDHVHAVTWGVIGGLVISTYVLGSNAVLAATDTLVQALGKLQAQINAITSSAITALTGDVTATGPGSVPATIAVGAVTDTKASLSNKPAVTVVATTNQTLSGAPTIDGQATTAGTSIALLTAQTTASQNGPWVVQSGAWTRPTWFPSGGTTQAFQFITMLVRLGTVYQGSTWRMTTSGAVTIDTTSTAWAVTPEAGNYRADYTIGTQTGSSAITLAFANAFKAILSWNPTANFTLTMPPTVPAAGQTLVAQDNVGTLQWSNPQVNIDGGSAGSVYVTSQVINGGTP